MKKRKKYGVMWIPSFRVALSVFALINLYTYFYVLACCVDRIAYVGFPLTFWETGGLFAREVFYPVRLSIDLVIVFGISGISGWVRRRLRSGKLQPNYTLERSADE